MELRQGAQQRPPSAAQITRQRAGFSGAVYQACSVREWLFPNVTGSNYNFCVTKCNREFSIFFRLAQQGVNGRPEMIRKRSSNKEFRKSFLFENPIDGHEGNPEVFSEGVISNPLRLHQGGEIIPEILGQFFFVEWKFFG